MTTNTLFPGRPDYTGPTVGMFGLLHHDTLCESSHDVMERVAYVKQNKPAREITIRLHNMIYLGDCPAATDYRAKRGPLYADYCAKFSALYADYDAKRGALGADYDAKIGPLYADYNAKIGPLYADYDAKIDALGADILAYIKVQIPDCAWNGKALQF